MEVSALILPGFPLETASQFFTEMKQALLDFNTPPPVPALAEVEILLNHLSNNPGFHTAKQLSAALAINDRKIRQLAEASDGLIISGPGSPGYCHLYHATAKQIEHTAEQLRSQARRMIARYIRIKKRAHKLIH